MSQLISVIIPCYNYGHLIGETLDSLIAQTYSNWEAIIVDDGSTDNTDFVIEGYLKADKRFKYFKQKNNGPSAARNLALTRAEGDYIQFLDADDIIESKKFEKQLRRFSLVPEIDIVYGNVRYFTKDAFSDADRKFSYWGVNYDWMKHHCGLGHEFLAEAVKSQFTHFSSCLFSKRILNRIGLWDIELRAAEDLQFILRCVMANAFFYFEDAPQTFALVRWHEKNTSKRVEWITEGDILMRKKIQTELLGIGNEEAVWNNEIAIKNLSLKQRRSWKKIFLSGGPFDFLKVIVRKFGIEKFVRKLFYKS